MEKSLVSPLFSNSFIKILSEEAQPVFRKCTGFFGLFQKHFTFFYWIKGDFGKSD